MRAFPLLPLVITVLAFVVCGVMPVRADAASEGPATSPVVHDETAKVPIEFYLARGEAGACGQGCNEWIVAEGKIDTKAAQKLRQLLLKLNGRQPPIFFHSPGGSVDGALALGRLIHQQKLTVSVGRTVPLGCDRDKPLEESCLALKRSGQEVEAKIDPTIAMCNSGCVYALTAGAVRLVPPWVKVGIHDVARDPDRMVLPGHSEAEEKRVTYGRIRSFLREVGADESLLTAAAAVPSNSLKFLQRDEIVHFRIDTREFGETPWQFTDKPAPSIRKRFFVRTDSEQTPYIDAVMGMDCGFGASMGVVFARQHLAVEPVSQSDQATISVANKSLRFGKAKSQTLYQRSSLVAMDAFDAVADTSTIVVPGVEVGREDDVTLNMDGFLAAHAKLREVCPEARRTAQSTTNWPGAQTVWPSTQTTRLPVARLTTIAQNEPPGPAAETRTYEFTKVAAAGQKLRVEFLYAIQPDCSSAGKIAVRVLEQPQHGTLTIEEGQGFTFFPKDNPRFACNTVKSDGTLVFYQPNQDYLGSDSVTLYVILPFGNTVTRHYAIQVK
jgi:hypothetical protein